MHKINYEHEQCIQEDDLQLSLLEISLKNGIPHIHACGGNGRCSTCRVAVLENLENVLPRNETEIELAQKKNLPDHIRLACQSRIRGPVTLRRLVIDEEDLREASTQATAGRERRLAILFSDVRQFTNFTESNLPYDVVHAMNRYFRRMGDSVKKNGGYIDKYIGDGLMALFGLEEDDPQLIGCQAVRAALDMLDGLEEVNAYLRKHLECRFDIGIGVHFGDVIAGEMGHPDKRQFTALGDNVNMASRIESVTKKARVPLLISEDLHAIVKDKVVVDKKFRTALKGKSGSYRLFHVSGLVEAAPGSAENSADVPKAAEAPEVSTNAAAPAQRKRFELPLLESHSVAENTMAFLIDTSGVDFAFRVGQFVNVRLPGHDGVRSFSLASSPHISDFVMIATRMRGSEYKRALAALEPGTKLIVEEARGNFAPQPQDDTTPAVYIVGGIGITPVRAMLELAVHRESSRPMTIFYSNREETEAAFFEEIQAWCEHLPGCRLVPVFTREKTEGSDAEFGRFDTAMLQRHVPDPAAPQYYVVGPEGMASQVRDILGQAGVPEDHIHLETFYGYDSG